MADEGRKAGKEGEREMGGGGRATRYVQAK